MRRPRRPQRPLALALGLVLALPAVPAAGSAETSTPAGAPAQACTPVLDEPLGGVEALERLGRDLPEVAARNRQDAHELRAALRRDEQLHVDRCGHLFYVDDQDGADHDHAARTDAAEADPSAGDAVTASYPPERTFELHSRPGADRTIYLDLDGHTLEGTAWNTLTNVPSSLRLPPFDLDGAPGFSAEERAVVQAVWQHVAEDFAPFGVNVTTQDPGRDAIHRTDAADAVFGTRVVVTDHDPRTTFCGGSCTGIAYVGVFDRHGRAGSSSDHAYRQPAMVFSGRLSPLGEPQLIADTISHEAGHNLGLHHHGDAADPDYAFGQGLWAPIMGSGVYPLSTWSTGDFSGATSTQDDVATMASRGAPLVADDHGASPATATELALPAVVDGLVGTRGDVDWFRFRASGATTLAARPGPVGPNLDLGLEVRAEDGTTVVAAADPTSSWPYAGTRNRFPFGTPVTGLDAHLELDLEPGIYLARITGVGSGDPAVDGYSDYGSLGRYSLEVTAEGTAAGPDPTPEPTPEPDPSPEPDPTPTATSPPPPTTSSTPRFSDVAPGGTHSRAIGELARRGVTLGCGGDRFCPDAPVTREQMATFLVRALGTEPGSSAPPFSDVTAGATHARSIDAMRRDGITLGCGGDRFCPGVAVPRDQMASFLQRALPLRPGSDAPPFRDVSAGSTHARAIDAVRRAAITLGCGDAAYCPGQQVTRAQMASFLVRALGW